MLKVLIVPLFFMFHPLHVSLTSINQEQGSDSMKVFFRMYFDDFLKDYELFDPGYALQKYTESQSFPADMLLEYFNDRVNIYVNNKRLTGEIVDLNIQDNEILMNLLYRSSKDPEKIRIRNRILTRLYNDQTNMVFLNINSNEQAMRLTPDHERETWLL
jgi:ribosomal protein S24E